MISPESSSPVNASFRDPTENADKVAFFEMARVAVQKAQAESRRLGVPNVYFINGEPWYELPSGELTREDPWQGQLTPPAPSDQPS